MVIGGVTDQFGPDSQKQTFIFDFDSNGWTEGPAMKFGRYHHACANIKASFTFFCVLFCIKELFPSGEFATNLRGAF